MDAELLADGRLVRSRVISDVRELLNHALERELTGYAVLEPGESLLLDADGKGVLTFEEGVPVLAYHTATDDGGPPALAAFGDGPYRADCYELGPGALAEVHDTPELRVPPGMPAERLAGDPALADRTRDRAPEGRPDRAEEAGGGAVAAFLENEERIERIREEARAEAQRRAQEWGLDDQLEGTRE
jgi:hypothetical protein